jgi:hypothetical protein
VSTSSRRGEVSDPRRVVTDLIRQHEGRQTLHRGRFDVLGDGAGAVGKRRVDMPILDDADRWRRPWGGEPVPRGGDVRSKSVNARPRRPHDAGGHDAMRAGSGARHRGSRGIDGEPIGRERVPTPASRGVPRHQQRSLHRQRTSRRERRRQPQVRPGSGLAQPPGAGAARTTTTTRCRHPSGIHTPA